MPAAWLTPDGRIVEVPKGIGYHREALEAAGYRLTIDEVLKQGWLRLDLYGSQLNIMGNTKYMDLHKDKALDWALRHGPVESVLFELWDKLTAIRDATPEDLLNYSIYDLMRRERTFGGSLRLKVPVRRYQRRLKRF